MKLFSLAYPALPELTNYPESERYRIYRSAYKRLMREDAGFRKHVNRFRLLILVLTALGLGLNWILDPLLHKNTWQHTVGLLSILVYSVAYPIYVLRASFSEAKFQCEKVGEALRNQTPS